MRPVVAVRKQGQQLAAAIASGDVAAVQVAQDKFVALGSGVHATGPSQDAARVILQQQLAAAIASGDVAAVQVAQGKFVALGSGDRKSGG